MADYQLQIKGNLPEDKELDPQVQAVLDRLAAGPTPPPLSERTPQDFRDGPNAILEDYLPELEGLTIFDRIILTSAREITVRVYQPEGVENRPVVLYIHGGCWVFCDLDSHDTICQHLSVNAKCTVVSVDYSLSPDVKFPVATEEIYEVAKWLKVNGSEVGGDSLQLIACGDSAGGNLSAVLSMMARDRGEFDIALQVLLYPITDISNFETGSYQKYQIGYFFEKQMMVWSGAHYIRDDADKTNPYVSPLVCDNLSNLPPAIVITAECDILRDEAEVYAEKLAQHDVDVTCIRYRGQVHAFIHMGGTVDLGKEALLDVCELVKKKFPTSSQV